MLASPLLPRCRIRRLYQSPTRGKDSCTVFLLSRCILKLIVGNGSPAGCCLLAKIPTAIQPGPGPALALSASSPLHAPCCAMKLQNPTRRPISRGTLRELAELGSLHDGDPKNSEPLGPGCSCHLGTCQKRDDPCLQPQNITRRTKRRSSLLPRRHQVSLAAI